MDFREYVRQCAEPFGLSDEAEASFDAHRKLGANLEQAAERALFDWDF